MRRGPPLLLIRPLHAADVLQVDLQPVQAAEVDTINLAYGERCEAGAGCWTAEIWDGADWRILGCGGVVPLHPHHGLAVALFSRAIGPHMVAVTRFARDWLASVPYRRIDAMVRDDFAAGKRWAAMIGMTPRVMLRHWGPNAADHWLYEVVR